MSLPYFLSLKASLLPSEVLLRGCALSRQCSCPQLPRLSSCAAPVGSGVRGALRLSPSLRPAPRPWAGSGVLPGTSVLCWKLGGHNASHLKSRCGLKESARAPSKEPGTQWKPPGLVRLHLRIGSCAGQLSIPVTNARESAATGREGLSWVLMLRVSAHD